MIGGMRLLEAKVHDPLWRRISGDRQRNRSSGNLVGRNNGSAILEAVNSFRKKVEGDFDPAGVGEKMYRIHCL